MDERTIVSPSRKRMVIGVVAACVVLPMFFILTHTNAKTNPQPFTRPGGIQTPAPVETSVNAATKHPIETFQVFAPRDPFEPVVISGGGTGTAGSTTRTPSPGSTTGTTSGTGASSGTSGDGSTSVTGHRVKLIDTFTQGGAKKARIEVDGTVYTVAPGETFATNFKLLSIQNECITAFFGDDQFSLCQGEEILK
ncbi:MAG: hypothetical protein ABR579_11590 [Actinomycetota bacterium]